MSWSSAFTTVVTALIAAGAALGGSWLTERRQARAKQRSDWAGFQRQALIDLQDTLMQIYATTAHDVTLHELGVKNPDADDPESTEKFVLLNGQARVLLSRLANQELAARTISVMQLVQSGSFEMLDSSGRSSFFDLMADIGDEIRRWNRAD